LNYAGKVGVVFGRDRVAENYDLGLSGQSRVTFPFGA
jgi:hypothetical protein